MDFLAAELLRRGFTRREAQIARILLENWALADKEIAAKQNMALRTLRYHVTQIYKKRGWQGPNRIRLVLWLKELHEGTNHKTGSAAGDAVREVQRAEKLAGGMAEKAARGDCGGAARRAKMS